jgi:hypothetical protein
VTDAPDFGTLQQIIPEEVPLTLSDERYSLGCRWKDMLTSISTFDPDMVLFVGLNSPLLTALYETRPVLGLCVHSVPPVAPVDVWLTAGKPLADRLSTVWKPYFPDAWGHYHPYRVWLKPINTPVSREDVELKEQDLVLVTAGARLELEIHGEWAAHMANLLMQHPTAVWLLVGGTGCLPPALANIAAAQRRILSHHEDLRSVFRCCDIYVNPSRIGGGFSVAEAMAEGLPVVAFSDSDGGNKLSDYVVANTEDYFARLQSLIADRALRKQTGTAMRALFCNTLDLEQSGPSLLAACNLALERYKLRLGQE